MAAFGFGVKLRGYHFENYHFTVVLASGITSAHEGRAVAVDPAAANRVKLAANGDQIIGRLEKVENRTQEGQLIGTVAFKFMDLMKIKSGLTGDEVVAVGSTVVGAGSGEVRARTVSSVATPDHNDNWVAELVTIGGVAYAVVVKV